MNILGESKMALCRRCKAPLISTLAFPQFEFYCLECGWLGGFLSPDPAPPTDELDKYHAALQAEWDEHVGDRLIVPRSWLQGCSLCKPKPGQNFREYHEEHTTEQEREADAKARAWLAERVRSL